MLSVEEAEEKLQEVGFFKNGCSTRIEFSGRD